jgi:hypothetical protein
MINTNTETKFITGNTYTTRSIGDADCRFSFTVTNRTAKFIYIKEHGRDVVRRKVFTMPGEDVERCLPHGAYSMAPAISAN